MYVLPDVEQDMHTQTNWRQEFKAHLVIPQKWSIVINEDEEEDRIHICKYSYNSFVSFLAISLYLYNNEQLYLESMGYL